MEEIRNHHIGYFVPEFPGQTHVFFWREIQSLQKTGIRIGLVSTQNPHESLVSHVWAKRAMEQTVYLFPPTCASILSACVFLLMSGPQAWWRCVLAIGRAKVLTFKEYLRLIAFMILGARLSRIAKHRRWCHIHVHSCADAANIAMFARLISGLPYSLTLHGPLLDYGRNQKEKWRHAQFAVVITRKLKREVQHTLKGYLPESVVIAPMGVDLNSFTRQRPYDPWQGSGACKIFSCGRLNPIKGHADLIRAVALLTNQGHDIRLRIAGEQDDASGIERQALEQLIKALALENQIKLLGAISDKAVISELESVHLFALASWHEPLGVAIMEAMAMKIPVVTTNQGGVPELVDDGRDGILVPPRNPAKLAAGILKIMKDPVYAATLSRNGREKIALSFHSNMSAETIAENLREREAKP